jgi:phage gp29-like protein
MSLLNDNGGWSFLNKRENAQMAAKATSAKRVLPWELKAVSRVRQNVKTWNEAFSSAQSATPKNFALQLLFNEIKLDALLTSQIENRKQQVLGIDFKLKNAAGEVDEEQTAMLRKMPAYRTLCNAILDARYHGYNLVELALTKSIDGQTELEVIVLPRTNVVPQLGEWYPDYSEDKKVLYREMAEYGTWILEFNTGELGLLNKAVPHILFKRFAQSCWSELCEIYGIPPRVMKTNTQDNVMLNRATQMMKDMGAAAWFIIDETESFEWAESTSTNGDVYKNLINLCNNEITLLITGAIIGQDTVNGNRSKEESSKEMLSLLVKSDLAELEMYWNSTIIPALVKIGVLKGDLTGEFEPAKDLEQLWKFTSGVLQYNKVDPAWIKTTFGVEVTGERESPVNDKGVGKEKLKLSDFFD